MAFTRRKAAWVLLLSIPTGWGQALTSNIIEEMGNNSLFTRWRPYSHFTAPHGWMNDPCGPLYDPVGRLYHMHYQWHPYHVNWGNISWGHATSEDLVTWTDVDHSPGNDLAGWQGAEAQSLGTTGGKSTHHNPPLYNRLGIWSGSAQAVNISGEVDGTLLAFYTSISELPTSFDTPYLTGTESQSLAYSYDGGLSWKQYAENPVLSVPPGNWNITGWRDPFFYSSIELDTLLHQPEPHYYLVFGSGIKGVGPRIPLYSAPASNLTNWTFLGALWEPHANSSLGSIMETGLYGFNFEVANFFSLDGHWFVSMGVQGANVSYHQQNWALWNEGTASKRSNGSLEFKPISGGVSDWGLLYAITTFDDLKNNRRIQYGWAWEDMDGFGITQQGFQGALSLPRELYIKRTRSVTHFANSSTIGNSRYTREFDGSWTATTLGLQPAPDVVGSLRQGSIFTRHNPNTMKLRDGRMMLPCQSQHSYEVQVTINSTTGIAGVIIGASPGQEEYTRIYYDPSNYTIVCDRAHSSLIKDFVQTSYVGYFEPYLLAFEDGSSITEPIEMDIFVDGSLVEIFVNGRFAMTSRIYPSREDSTGIGLFAASNVEVTWTAIDLWEGLAPVWPHRPKNSSSQLVQDTLAETNNGIWWQGN